MFLALFLKSQKISSENNPESAPELVEIENQEILQESPNIKLKNKITTVMLNPAGDAQNTGKIIGDGFERNLTLQIAQEIENFFKYDGSTKIILSRSAGESLEPLQNISFANRLNIDFYLDINVAQNSLEDKNQNFDNNKKIFIYYHIINPVEDRWPKKFDNLSLISIDQIYLKNISKTIDFADIFSKTLKNYTKKISVYSGGPIGVPLKSLLGLNCPAISCEILVNSKFDIKEFIEPICQAIKKITEQIS